MVEVAVSSSVPAWTLRMPAGSAQEWTFTLTTQQTPGGFFAPYPIPGGSTWEYVVRNSPTDTGVPGLSITTSAGVDGVLLVTSTAVLSQVQLGMVATATAGFSPGIYYHALWMNPGTASAVAVFDGELIIEGAPAP